MAKKTNSAIFEYQNKKGEKLFGFKIYLGTDPITRKKKTTTRRGFNTYTEAAVEFTKLKMGGLQNIVDEKITMNQLFKLWYKTYSKGVKESTANKTAETYRLHIKPIFGKMYIIKIEPRMFQSFVDQLSDELVNYKRVLTLVSRMYKYAISLDLAKTNPTANVIFPKKTSRPRRDISAITYERNQLNDFLAAASESTPKIYTYFLLLSSTGLRRGEAMALTWDDIDFDNMTININKTLTIGKNNRQIVNPPKTPKSNRQVPMTDNLAKQLRKYKFENAKYNKLFHTYKGGYESISKPHQWLHRVYDKHPELKQITIHGFRHTFATLLFESNPDITPKDVQDILGHETVEMTLNVYTHVTEKGKQRVKSALNNMNL